MAGQSIVPDIWGFATIIFCLNKIWPNCFYSSMKMFPARKWSQGRCQMLKAAAPKCHPSHKLKPGGSVPTLSKAHAKLLSVFSFKKFVANGFQITRKSTVEQNNEPNIEWYNLLKALRTLQWSREGSLYFSSSMLKFPWLKVKTNIRLPIINKAGLTLTCGILSFFHIERLNP